MADFLSVQGQKDFWLGKQYKPDPNASRIAGRAGLEADYGRLTGLNGRNVFDQRQALADQLQRVASGQEAGAGELAAKRAGQAAIANQMAMAASARGYGAMNASRQAARNSAQIGGSTAGEATRAALQDQAAARQLQSGLLAGMSQDQLTAMAARGDLRAREMLARMQQESNLAAEAAQDVGLLPGLLDAGAKLIPAII